MTILQVTPDAIVEHPVFPGEAPHYRLSTIEAQRFIGGLANGERKRFDALTDADGNPDPRQQEEFVIINWMESQDTNSLAGHYASRALQSVRHILQTGLKQDADRVEKRYYYPLLDTPKAPFVAELHWDQEDRFRRGISKVVSSVTGHPQTDIELQPIKRGEAPLPLAYGLTAEIGRVVLSNKLQFNSETGDIFGSSYVVSIVPSELARSSDDIRVTRHTI